MRKKVWNFLKFCYNSLPHLFILAMAFECVVLAAVAFIVGNIMLAEMLISWWHR
jgi:hypothetical protein